ncbi:MAG: hypothetical protein IK017_01430 [Paludibacteraceae bacterium]|nr:hypothetical protein [Paludibacteraceae bacterium]
MESKKETIFDHNPTDEELKRWGGRETFEYFNSKGIDILSDDDSNYYMIGILYASRGDDKTAEKYFSKIKHKKMLSTLVEDF